MKVLIALFLLSGCALDVNHKVSGEATVKVELDPQALLEGFTQACTAVEAEDIDQCVNEQLGNYFRTLAKAMGDQE